MLANSAKRTLIIIMTLAAIAALAAVACSSEPTVIEREVVVEVEKEVVREVMVPGETVVVEKEVVKTIEVPGETVVVQKEVAPTPGPKKTIVFSDLNWASAQVQNRIAQYIVEKGYGYPTDVVFGSTLPLFQGLRRGATPT